MHKNVYRDYSERGFLMKRMEITKIFKLVIAVTFGVLLSLTPAMAAEFSADMVFQPKGEESMVVKVYVKGDKMRQEATEEGEKQIVIIRGDKKISWMIDPEEKKYIEMPYEEEGNLFEEWSQEKQKNAKFLADENAAGLPSKKYEVTEDGQKITVWISKKYSFPVKVEDPEAVVEYKNINDGSVDDTLFELPAGYEKIVVPAMPEPKETDQ
jgi:outer membrane lipoprotein-sorting protein